MVPTRDSPADAGDGGEGGPPREAGGGGPLPILLVVDDEELVLNLVKRCLSGAFTVLSARDGREGLEMARAERPDVILTDYSMPGMSGWDLCRAVRREKRLARTRVILMSGTWRPEGNVFVGKMFDGFLGKPFGLVNLKAALCLD